ncbi:MAG TPA: hypothetical protein VF809_01715 [Candidatus Saccharimonadales bacterium]
MTPELLTREVGVVFEPDLEGAGAELQALYDGCAQRYVDIAQVLGAPRAGADGRPLMPAIKLGRFNYPDIGDVDCTAMVRVTHFNEGGKAPKDYRAAFGVEVLFFGNDSAGHRRDMGAEYFGAPACNFVGMRMPVFVRRPGATFEEPWPEEPTLYSYVGIRYPWGEGKNYQNVYRRLMPMIDQACDTQAMLVTALQDPMRNPEYAARAVDLTMPPGY